MPLDCTNNNITVEQILNAILATDTNGSCSIRLIPVAADLSNADYANCDNANQDSLSLFRQLIGVDGNGNLGLRVIEVTDSGENCKDCDNQNIPFEDQIAKHTVGLADDGYPALRLATL